MPALRVRHRQPIAALWYASIGPLLLVIVVISIGSAFAASQTIQQNSLLNLGPLLLPIAALVAIVILALPILDYVSLTYELSEQAITLNSGIIFREYESVNFNRIQVVDDERGPLLMLFGLTEVRIWTASPDQLGVNAEHALTNPDLSLLLAKNDAESVRQFMTHTLSSPAENL